LDLSWPWECLDRIYKEELDTGWLTSIGYDGEVLITPKDGLENQSQDLVWVPRLGFCFLIGLNAGLLLAFSLDITP
jgi:hypothetical protein